MLEGGGSGYGSRAKGNGRFLLMLLLLLLLPPLLAMDLGVGVEFGIGGGRVEVRGALDTTLPVLRVGRRAVCVWLADEDGGRCCWRRAHHTSGVLVPTDSGLPQDSRACSGSSCCCC